MARVDLKCGCGYKFFVGDAQVKAGVECPACGQPVAVPGAAPVARKAAPAKPAPKPAAPEPDDAEDFDSLPPDAPSKKKLYIIGGAVAAGVVAIVAVLLVILLQPKVDYEKQAQADNERRKK